MARPVLYLLPGLLCDESYWSGPAARLEGEAEVRRIGRFDFDSLQEMARSVLDQAPERFCVAGHSMGARVAFEIVALAPERVERIAILDSGAHPPRPGEADGRMKLVNLAINQGMEALIDAWLLPMIWEPRRQDAGLVEPMAEMVRRSSPETFRKQQTALINRPDANSRLPLVTVPCALIVGRQDAWSPPEQHEAIRAQIPHARLTVVEDCGHMSITERPAEVARALSAWLSA